MWALIIAFYFGTGSPSVTTVNGFLTQDACMKTGNQVVAALPRTEIRFICVQVFK